MLPARIYCEKQAFDHTISQAILAKFPNVSIILIDHYKDVFNRSQQSFAHQKNNQALILAKKERNFFYRAAERIISFGEAQLVYTDQIRNCIYDCDYCFLQGMHRSAHLLIFVNEEDFLQAIQTELTTTDAIALSISYLTDLLAFEELYPWHQKWLELAKQHPHLSIESRTKSNNAHILFAANPVPNFILTWSLNPKQIIRTYELGCASFENRIFQLQQALQLGWTVRISIDPIILIPQWKQVYHDFIDLLAQRIDLKKIDAISYGFFRMHPAQLDYMKKDRKTPLLHYDYKKKNKNYVGYEDAMKRDAQVFIQELLSQYYAPTSLYFVDG